MKQLNPSILQMKKQTQRTEVQNPQYNCHQLYSLSLFIKYICTSIPMILWNYVISSPVLIKILFFKWLLDFSLSVNYSLNTKLVACAFHICRINGLYILTLIHFTRLSNSCLVVLKPKEDGNFHHMNKQVYLSKAFATMYNVEEKQLY